MKIDITEILNGRVEIMGFQYSFDETSLGDAEYALLPDDIKLAENGIHVEGTVSEHNGYMTLWAKVSAEYTTVCGRCLDELHEVCEFEIERIIRSGSALNASASFYDEEDEWDGVTEDLLYVSESSVCPDIDIMETLSLNLPLYHLCSDDCEGLCPICGKKLSEKACTCLEDEKNKKEIDPRLAKLQKLLENPEKV